MEASYTVTHRDGCTLILGALPVDDLAALSKAAGPTAVLSPHLAQLAGVTFAWGEAKAVVDLTATLTREKTELFAGHSDVDRWLAVGQQGMSSLAMVQHLTGRQVAIAGRRDRLAHPHDADDLSRCRLLLEQAPSLAPELPRMASLSPVWAALVREWPSLCQTMDKESPRWRDGEGDSPRTCMLMRALIDGAK